MDFKALLQDWAGKLLPFVVTWAILGTYFVWDLQKTTAQQALQIERMEARYEVVVRNEARLQNIEDGIDRLYRYFERVFPSGSQP